MAGTRGERLLWDRFETEIGPLFVALSGRGVCRIALRARSAGPHVEGIRSRFGGRPERSPRALRAARREIDSYLAGEIRRFSLRVDLRGLTPFQVQVLRATAEIPIGTVASYGEIAARIRRPRAARAVGNALNGNPVPLLVPCHRVVAGDGGIGGFGGGLALKRRLLRIEGAL